MQELGLLNRMLIVLKSLILPIYDHELVGIMAGSRGADGVPKADGTSHN